MVIIMFSENCEWMGPGYYKVNRPIGQEQLDSVWCEDYEEYDIMIQYAETDYVSGFDDTWTFVTYEGEYDESR